MSGNLEAGRPQGHRRQGIRNLATGDREVLQRGACQRPAGAVGCGSRGVGSALLVIILMIWAGSAHALGLGQATVRSYFQQPLEARIDLISRSEAEMATVTAGLASPADFQVMGLQRAAIATPLEFTIYRDLADPHIRITSKLPMREPVVQLVVEVVWASGRMLRQYTLFLDPPTFDAPAPLPVTPSQRVVPPAGETANRTSETEIAAVSQPAAETSPFTEDAPAPLPPPAVTAPAVVAAEPSVTDDEGRDAEVSRSGSTVATTTTTEAPASPVAEATEQTSDPVPTAGPPFAPVTAPDIEEEIVTRPVEEPQQVADVPEQPSGDVPDAAEPFTTPAEPAAGPVEESVAEFTDLEPAPVEPDLPTEDANAFNEGIAEAGEEASTIITDEPAVDSVNEDGPDASEVADSLVAEEPPLESPVDAAQDNSLSTPDTVEDLGGDVSDALLAGSEDGLAETVSEDAADAPDAEVAEIVESTDPEVPLEAPEEAFALASSEQTGSVPDTGADGSPEAEIPGGAVAEAVIEPGVSEADGVETGDPAGDLVALEEEVTDELTTDPALDTAIEDLAEADAEAQGSVGEPPATEDAVEQVAQEIVEDDEPSVADETGDVDEGVSRDVPAVAQREEPAPDEREDVTAPAAEPVYRAVMPSTGSGLSTSVEIQRGDTLWSLSKTYAQAEGVSVNQVMLAVQQANPSAFRDGNINQMLAGEILRMPDRDEMLARNAREAMLEVMRQEALYRTRWDTPTSPSDIPTVSNLADAASSESFEPSSEDVTTTEQANNASSLLELVPPSEGAETEIQGLGQGGSSDTGVSSGESVVEELARTQEELANARQENTYLADRVAELESRLARGDGQDVDGIADTTLAEMEDRLRDERLSGDESPDLELGDAASDSAVVRYGGWIFGLVALLVAGLVLWLRRQRDPEYAPGMADREPGDASSDGSEGGEGGQPGSDSSVQSDGQSDGQPERPSIPDAESGEALDAEPGSDAAATASTEPEESDEESEIGADAEDRLNLARAYQAMGKPAEAREQLEAVIREGNLAQIREAREMLGEL